MADNSDPEKIFEIQGQIGEGSYGSVFKAVHTSTKITVAIKIIPVETDLTPLMKEIKILKTCKSDYIVRYYGSYYKDSDLWIVMEYCGGGSLSDLMMKGRLTLREDEIRYVISEVLMGLAYLHDQRKIHRDIKSGNILLSDKGVAKLADFGVSVQLENTISKRQTVIGTPFWMAPEVIQQNNYDCKADIWSLGITAIELAEGLPPYADIHPMRAIFMIPNRPPPRLKDESKWSKEFVDFIARCLVKNPEERLSAHELLEHPFVAATCERLRRGHGVSATMRNMVSRLKELKSMYRKKEKKEKVAPAVYDEGHGVNDVLNEREEHPAQDERGFDTVQMKESAMPTPSIVMKPMAPVRAPPSSPPTVPSQRPCSPEAFSAPKLRVPPPPVTGRLPLAIPPVYQAPIAKSTFNVESITSMALPDIPTQRPTNTSNLKEWIKCQHTAKDIRSQFKSDLQMLQACYKEKMDALISDMNSLCDPPSGGA